MTGRRRWGGALLPALLALPSVWGEATRFGHRAYVPAPAGELAEAGRYRDTGRVVRLRAPAAAAFQRMVRAARADGVRLIPISGFRSLPYQERLWTRAVARHGSPAAAARWVAPPGFSEHHTGWAVDLGDESARGTDVEPSFENTRAHRWLRQNAERFGWELSFPPGNAQGVSHEPWHWRWVGDEAARRVFHPEA